MILDLKDELITVRSFFENSIEIADKALVDEAVRCNSVDEEMVEMILTDPRGAIAFEQFVFRAVIQELNSIYEFALQQTWVRLFGLNVPFQNGKKPDEDELVFVANRVRIEKLLTNANYLGEAITDVEDWPCRLEILKIKELAEAFKHRQRFQPFADNYYLAKNKKQAIRRVNPNTSSDEYPLAEYRLERLEVSRYIDAIGELLRWLTSKQMLGMS